MKDLELYRQICINGQAKLDGAITYFDESGNIIEQYYSGGPLFDHTLSINIPKYPLPIQNKTTEHVIRQKSNLEIYQMLGQTD